MTLRDLYPYLSDIHEDLIERLSLLDDDYWTSRPCPPATLTVRQAVARAVERERALIQEIAQMRRPGSSALEVSRLSNSDLLSELEATRVVTERYVATLAPEMLRTVRAVPADPARNIPESNMPLSWVLWSVVENEITAAALVSFLIDAHRS